VLATATEKLALLSRPVAKMIVKRTAAQATSVRDLYEASRAADRRRAHARTFHLHRAPLSRRPALIRPDRRSAGVQEAIAFCAGFRVFVAA